MATPSRGYVWRIMKHLTNYHAKIEQTKYVFHTEIISPVFPLVWTLELDSDPALQTVNGFRYYSVDHCSCRITEFGIMKIIRENKLDWLQTNHLT